MVPLVKCINVSIKDLIIGRNYDPLRMRSSFKNKSYVWGIVPQPNGKNPIEEKYDFRSKMNE